MKQAFVILALLFLWSCSTGETNLNYLPSTTSATPGHTQTNMEGTIFDVTIDTPPEVVVGKAIPVNVHVAVQPLPFPLGLLVADSLQLRGALSAPGVNIIDLPPKTRLSHTGFTIENNDILCDKPGEMRITYRAIIDYNFVSTYQDNQIVTQGPPSAPEVIVTESLPVRCVEAPPGCEPFDAVTVNELPDRQGGQVRLTTTEEHLQGDCNAMTRTIQQTDEYYNGAKSLNLQEVICQSGAMTLETNPATYERYSGSTNVAPGEEARFDNIETRLITRASYYSYCTTTTPSGQKNILNPESSGDIAVPLCTHSQANNPKEVAYLIQRCDDILPGSSCVRQTAIEIPSGKEYTYAQCVQSFG